MRPHRSVGKRSSLRLAGYDYTLAGAYFITIIAHKRECLFGEVIGGEVVLSPYGEVVKSEWLASAGIRQEIQLHDDEFVVMPNHVHGIVWIVQDEQEFFGDSGGQGTTGVNDAYVGPTGRSPLRQIGLQKPGPAPGSLGSFVAGFKAAATREINHIRGTPGKSVWKRNYFDRVIRDEDELQHLRQYIYKKPMKWELDRENPGHK
jgi:REP element-mobilizing transposase RayT